MTKPPLTILLASPRGFCAGVDRAIGIVDEALRRYGPPVYVRHEIVHNKYVVQQLQAKGAIFVEELDEVPDDAVVVFSAHGVPKAVPAEAKRRELIMADATCPLVSKVHREVERHHAAGHQVVLIGHEGHPEVIGTMGQVPKGSVVLVQDVEEVATLEVEDPERLAYATQTTLSVLDTAGIVTALKERFPAIHGPRSEDICYATTNRQQAVEMIAPNADLTLVLGSPNSSNSQRLVEVALRSGCPRAALVDRAEMLDWSLLDGVTVMALSAGASAPEVLVDDMIVAAQERFDVEVREIKTAEERVVFKLPPMPAARAS
ncbi:4-hydroxy-3-methylbut-2-enyl diphosphate reductase [Marinivivus vitaminiproducens]|uniref:4-hydroxy-3-methylbut-2-enyl diphosphate reductase n=1 Tax=Marinivivus vitaminiproducens TaxID=3035935 RepID=UPI00279D8594|nr:4-hydroxy-3-methylbut-2-enyl diphosphate reductase [Geminicoccaceae bacterium SCSIO 64248]